MLLSGNWHIRITGVSLTAVLIVSLALVLKHSSEFTEWIICHVQILCCSYVFSKIAVCRDSETIGWAHILTHTHTPNGQVRDGTATSTMYNSSANEHYAANAKQLDRHFTAEKPFGQDTSLWNVFGNRQTMTWNHGDFMSSWTRLCQMSFLHLLYFCCLPCINEVKSKENSIRIFKM